MAKALDFSVVIPTYQRPKSLVRLLSSLTFLNYDPERFEVIVVNDGGDYPVEKIVRIYGDKLNIVFSGQENQGPAAARNNGSRLAGGEYLAFIDDDCVADPDWLSAMAARLKEKPFSACGGKVANALLNNPYSAATQLLTDYLYEHYSPLIRLTGFFPAANLTVPREVFMNMGGFDPTLRFGEDRDLCYRWASRGHPFVTVPEAIVYHFHALNFFSLLSLHFSYGGGTFQFWRRHNPGVLRIATLNSPSWHLRLLLYAIRDRKISRGLSSTPLLFLIQLACIAGIFWQWARSRSNT
jgi:GT2 family glycosyltransferase